MIITKKIQFTNTPKGTNFAAGNKTLMNTHDEITNTSMYDDAHSMSDDEHDRQGTVY